MAISYPKTEDGLSAFQDVHRSDEVEERSPIL
jgi:hypothetical protein